MLWPSDALTTPTAALVLRTGLDADSRVVVSAADYSMSNTSDEILHAATRTGHLRNSRHGHGSITSTASMSVHSHTVSSTLVQALVQSLVLVVRYAQVF